MTNFWLVSLKHKYTQVKTASVTPAYLGSVSPVHRLKSSAKMMFYNCYREIWGTAHCVCLKSSK